jgi:ATP-dependent Zn protease
LLPGVGDDRADIASELLRAHHHILELLGGVEAEKLFTAEPLSGTSHDLEEASAIASLICRSPAAVNAYLDFCHVEVATLLTQHRASVLAIAAALIERRTLNGTEIDSIHSAP